MPLSANLAAIITCLLGRGPQQVFSVPDGKRRASSRQIGGGGSVCVCVWNGLSENLASDYGEQLMRKQQSDQEMSPTHSFLT